MDTFYYFVIYYSKFEKIESISYKQKSHDFHHLSLLLALFSHLFDISKISNICLTDGTTTTERYHMIEI